MKKYALTLLGLIIVGGSFAQTGYYGFQNSFGVSISEAPSLRYKIKMKEEGSNTILKKSLRIANTSFHVNYNRVIHNKLGLGVGYTYSNVRLLADRVATFGAVRLIEDIKTPYHGVTLKLKYFRFGNVNPVGKFIGFALEYGQSKLDVLEYTGAANYELLESSRYATKYNAFDFQTHNDTISVDRFNTYFVKVLFGRNIPLTKNLFFSFEGSFNLVGLSILNGTRNFSGLGDILGSRSINANPLSSSNTNYALVSDSIFAYKRLMLNFGIHFAF